MLKVLHILACGGFGGAERLIADYARYSQHDNYFVFVWEDGHYEEVIRGYGCTTYYLDAKRIGSIKATRKLLEIISDIHPDAIVTQHGSPMIRAYATMLTKRYPGIPVLMYEHCDPKDELNKNHPIARKMINVAAVRNAAKIIAISNFVKDGVVRYYEADPDKVEVIYNGVDTSRFADCNIAIHDPVQLIYVGRLERAKGVQIALQAVKICIDHGYQLSYRIVGDGVYRSDLEELARRLGVVSYCEFTGTRTDIPELLQDADVFVHSCIWEEGFGIAIVEAMAAGKICVCSNAGAIPELITDGANGYLVERGNPEALARRIMLLIDDPNHWSSIQKQAIQSASRYDVQVFVSRLDELLQETVHDR